MATIHATTMAPTKLELVSGWLPRQPWYRDPGAPPALSRAGGFRLDDPAGEVGIEFLLVTDTAGGGGTTYAVPLTYRAAPLDGADEGLLGTSEHGVLGTRWIYDAAHDPVAIAQLLAFLQGESEAQHQSRSDTPDPSVRASRTAPGHGESSVEVVRVLAPGAAEAEDRGRIEADWILPDGSTARGPVAVLR
jgi:hypothetical protein